jgi:hypothetical protein
MSKRRLVFVPIFGDGCPQVGEQLPTVKAWGFYGDEMDQFIPIHTEPQLQAIALLQPYVLFQPEVEAMVDVPENSTDLPDEVCLALAKLALLPVSSAN